MAAFAVPAGGSDPAGQACWSPACAAGCTDHDGRLVGAGLLVGLSRLRGLVDLAGGVVDRGVDRVQLHRLVTDVGDVVPRSGRHQDRPAVLHLPVEVQPVLRRTHLDAAATTVQPKELVGFRVRLQPHVPTHGDRHQRQLQVRPRPRHGSVVRVRPGSRSRGRGSAGPARCPGWSCPSPVVGVRLAARRDRRGGRPALCSSMTSIVGARGGGHQAEGPNPLTTDFR